MAKKDARITEKTAPTTKEDVLTFNGIVSEALPDSRYRVRLDSEHIVTAYTSGRMRKNRIKTLIGDRVVVEMTPYDLTKGRVVFRYKGGTGPGSREENSDSGYDSGYDSGSSEA